MCMQIITALLFAMKNWYKPIILPKKALAIGLFLWACCCTFQIYKAFCVWIIKKCHKMQVKAHNGQL